jgi:hypothetical protein
VLEQVLCAVAQCRMKMRARVHHEAPHRTIDRFGSTVVALLGWNDEDATIRNSLHHSILLHKFP